MQYHGRTHLDILNGLFQRSLGMHCRASCRLNDSELVWFPHVSRRTVGSVDDFGAISWANWISQDGTRIYEHCTDEHRRATAKRDRYFRRYVFAKFVRENEYVFIGVFAYEGTENGMNLYKKVGDVPELEACLSSL